MGVRPKPPHGLGLAGDTLATFLIQAVSLYESEGHVAIQQGVVGQVDPFLAPFPEETADLVTTTGEGGWVERLGWRSRALGRDYGLSRCEACFGRAEEGAGVRVLGVELEDILGAVAQGQPFALREGRLSLIQEAVNLALDALPNFTCFPGEGPHLRGAVSISPGVEYMERAYDDAKYGRFSRRPYIDIVIPTLTDPSVAPPGKHVMSCFVQYAPYHLKEGSWPDRREEFGDTVVDTLSEYAPNLRNIILHRQVLTPWDLEREFGLTEGNIFHGELALDQLLFMRPVPGWAQYRTPIKNLYLCAAGTHPGGGVMGASGRLAALEILKDWKRRKI